MKHLLTLLFLLLSLGIVAAQDKFVTVSDRQLPIAYDVDVLVIGGSTGNVAAAIEAQKAGAKTMLITDRPYLGDDMTATLKLWLEPGEKLDDPLAAAIFNDPNRGKPGVTALSIIKAEKKLPFTYTIAEKIDAAHGETAGKNRLSDGSGADPVEQSLQINGNATVMVDLKQSQPVGVVSLCGFYRIDNFVIDSVAVSTSTNGTDWKTLGNATLTAESKQTEDAPVEFRLTLDKPTTARYLKLNVKKTEKSKRILLGEIVVLSDKTLIPDPQTQKPINSKYTHPAPRPMHVKTVLDKALEEAGVQFLYSTYHSGGLADKDGKMHGVVINNKAGRQVILAKVTLFVPPVKTVPHIGEMPKKTSDAHFVVIGGEPKEIDAEKYPRLKGASYEIMGEPFYGPHPNRAKTQSGTFPIIRYTFPLADIPEPEDIKTVGELEKQIRLATYDPDQQFTSDSIEIPWAGKTLLTTTQLIAAGRELGKTIGGYAVEQPKVNPAELRVFIDGFEEPSGGRKIVSGEVKESLANVKPFKEPLGYLKQGEQQLPVVAEYDVVVVGGGTTGAPAGIAAARQGAKTLVLEYLHDLGGTGTAGAITVYWYGNRVGFTKEVQNGQSDWAIEQRVHWWRSKLAEAGADTWYGVLGTGTIVETDKSFSPEPRVKGVIIATPSGPQAVLAKVVIDTTGNGYMAETAGARILHVDGSEIAVQGHGLPPRHLGASYTNTDYLYVDETDIEDTTHAYVYGKEKFPWAFDFGKMMDTRERRRVVGEFSFTALDQINKRTYPDTIVQAMSNYDTHGYTITPYFELEHLYHEGLYADVPMRSSVPQELESILVGGLATSCHRDAMPIIRMQPDLQNQGYALGCIAAKAAKENVPIRKLDIKPIQEHLVEIGNLPERVLTDQDNYGNSIKDLPAAVKTIPDNYKGAAVVLWYPKESLPLLKEAYNKATTQKDKRAYAMMLAAMEDATGAEILIEAVKSFDKWDAGWNFRGMGQFGWASSPLDRTIMMLGRTKDKRGAAVIAEKLKLLKSTDDFSHHRACALALEWIGDSSAAPAIAGVLKKPGVSGYTHQDLATARKWDKADPKGSTAEQSRRDSLIEIGYARALYRLGDVNGLGKKILEDYSTDMRGYFNRHANEILK